MTRAPRPAHRPRHALGAGPAPLPRHRAAGPAPAGRRTALAGAMAAVVAAGTAAAAAPAHAFAGPVVHTTAAWGARRVRTARTPGRPTELVIHHMASPNTSATAAPPGLEAPAGAKAGVKVSGSAEKVPKGQDGKDCSIM